MPGAQGGLGDWGVHCTALSLLSFALKGMSSLIVRLGACEMGASFARAPPSVSWQTG